MNSVKTNKGTDLPLMNLKGKPYMMVAHRIVWFNEEVASYTMTSEFLEIKAERAVVKATVNIYNEAGRLIRSAVGTKAENKADFADFVEKAETGAIGRAITALGFGTAYALADLDEGTRIIDAPVTVTPKVQTSTAATPPPQAAAGAVDVTSPQVVTPVVAAPSAAPQRSSSFRNRKTAAKPDVVTTATPVAPVAPSNGAAKVAVPATGGDGW